MRRPRLNFLIDGIAFAAFVFLAGTGVLMCYVLPPGSGHFLTLWGLDRQEWGVFHFWIAVTLMAALALHLLLHWRWVVGMIQGPPREGSGVRIALAFVSILGLIGLALSPFFDQVEHDGEPPHKMRSGEVEQLTGVSSEVILRELGLPPGVPVDERLGRLRRQYGFRMDDLREVVRKHTGNK